MQHLQPKEIIELIDNTWTIQFTNKQGVKSYPIINGSRIYLTIGYFFENEVSSQYLVTEEAQPIKEVILAPEESVIFSTSEIVILPNDVSGSISPCILEGKLSDTEKRELEVNQRVPRRKLFYAKFKKKSHGYVNPGYNNIIKTRFVNENGFSQKLKNGDIIYELRLNKSTEIKGDNEMVRIIDYSLIGFYH
jgi:deoxycytidine triphosphate deaminase